MARESGERYALERIPRSKEARRTGGQMSAPNLVLREADQLRYGVLSIRAVSALRVILGRQRLDVPDREVLRQAAEFLADVAEGVRIASTGTFRHGARPSR